MLVKLCLALLFISGPALATTPTNDLIAGQFLFLGIHGTKLKASSVKKIEALKPGGIILFGSNIKSFRQTARLIRSINGVYDSSNSPRPFIAIDQEGGYVTRIKTYPKLPSAALLGLLGDDKITREISYHNSSMLRALGINMNFSPVLDVQSEHGNEFLGSRSFSVVPRKVGELAERIVEGANQALVVSTAKHFPGHGDLSIDSHKDLPISHKNVAQLNEKEFVPYIPMIEENKIPAIMVGHMSFPRIDPTGLPASFSKKIVTDILKYQLSFKGLIVTDDIQMEGAKIAKDPGLRAVMSLKAGVDIVMVAWNPKAQARAFASIKKELEKNPKFRTAAYEKYSKIMKIKKQFSIINTVSIPSEKNGFRAKAKLEASVTKLFTKLQYDSIHSSYNQQNSIDRSKPRVVISKFKTFYDGFRKSSSKARTLFFKLDKKMSSQKLKNILKKYPGSPIYFQISSPWHQRLIGNLSVKTKDKILFINSQTMKPLTEKWVLVSKTNMPSLGYFLKHNKRSVANQRTSD